MDFITQEKENTLACKSEKCNVFWKEKDRWRPLFCFSFLFF